VINILAADKLMQKSPKVYATFLLWMLAELFENLPEIGDPEKPKFVLFFDEAHLLFPDIAPPVEQKIEQMVRLIRSEGVGVYFVSQNPSIFRMLCWVSSGIACSTRCARSPRVIRKR
jgi:DNA helicase HerA-like ATPase